MPDAEEKAGHLAAPKRTNRLPALRMSLLTEAAFSIRAWWVISLIWAGIMAWVDRHTMNPDGLSYLDIGSEFVKGGAGQLVNGYWSPAYPAFIGVTLALVRPSRSLEIPTLHVLNLFLFAATLAAYTFLIKQWVPEGDANSHNGRRYLIPLLFSIFLCLTMQHIGVGLVTPDLLVSAIVFLAAGMTLRLTRVSNWSGYFGLGGILAFGYYSKTVMFPLGMALLLLLLVWPPSPKVSRAGVLVAAMVFLLFSAPGILAISHRVGRLSIGETGGLNYLWYANQRDLTDESGWRGTFGSEYTSLAHPPRLIAKTPLTLAFANPLPGTYPLWYDPSYWWSGARIRFNPAQQVSAVMQNLRVYADGVLPMSALVGGLLALCVCAGSRRLRSGFTRQVRWALAWPVVALLIFVPVHVEYRLVSGFVVLFWSVAYRIAARMVEVRIRIAVLSTVIPALLLPAIVRLGIDTERALGDAVRGRRQDYQIVAESLQQRGFAAGDRLALVGDNFNPYYARLARLQVVAQIYEADKFWQLTPAELRQLARQLASVQVKAILAKNPPPGSLRPNWLDIDASPWNRYSLLLLPIGDPAENSLRTDASR